jgi:hypothetical protein
VDEDAFWAVIEQSSAAAAAGGRNSRVERQIVAQTDALSALTDAEVRGFDRHLRSAVARANDWRLWAAGHLAAGGMSDDAFTDFRVWLVHQGRTAFERVLADPDALAELTWDEQGEDFADAEELLYVAGEVLEDRGAAEADEDEDDAVVSDGEPSGEPFPEDDDVWLAANLPRLWARMERAGK